MITEYVDYWLWRRHFRITASCRGGEGVGPHCSGVKPYCETKINVLGSARIACLCFLNVLGYPLAHALYVRHVPQKVPLRQGLQRFVCVI